MNSTRNSRSFFGAATRRAGGFTLVELLVVIGIIALLISILLPALNKARQSASSLACQANLHSIGQGLLLYCGENHGTLPYGWWDGVWPAMGNFDTSKENDWVTLTIASLNGKYTATANDVATNGSITTRMRGMFLCPDAPGQGVETSDHSSVSHYGSHPRLMPVLNGQNLTQPYYLPYKIAHIQRSAEVGLIFDASLIHRITNLTNNQPDPLDTWTQANTIPVLLNMDGGMHTAPAAGGFYGPTKLTDNYVTSGVSYTASDQIDMTTNSLGSTLHSYNSDVTGNVSNIRFRHLNNSVANALMVDGHVQSFHFHLVGGKSYTTDLLHKNINVNQ